VASHELYRLDERLFHDTMQRTSYGLPALSVPFTFSSEQLPINVQLVSRWLDEAKILRLGLLIEARNKVNHRRPNL